MLQNPFTPAKKEQIYLRMAVIGASGSGKTWTALTIGSMLAALRGGKMAFIDTEGRSARKYADKFTFDVLDLSKNFNPQEYINAINAAVQHGYSVIVVDSFTHAWNGAGGVLDIVDKAGQKMGGNKFAGWATGRPAQNSLAETVLNAQIDIIGTMRSKTEWSIQPDPKTGKDKPVKVGLAPVQSEDFEYEFDVVAYMDMEHTMSITKTRCSELDRLENGRDMEFISSTLYAWLTDGDMPVNPSKLAASVLNSDDGKSRFRAFCTSLGINGNGDSTPYLEALAIKQFSAFAGEYDDLCEQMTAIHEKLAEQKAAQTSKRCKLVTGSATIDNEETVTFTAPEGKLQIKRSELLAKLASGDADERLNGQRQAEAMMLDQWGHSSPLEHSRTFPELVIWYDVYQNGTTRLSIVSVHPVKNWKHEPKPTPEKINLNAIPE